MKDDLHPSKNDGRRDNALTCLLRDADPAGGESELGPAERARMRQIVTDAAGQRSRGWAGDWRGWVQPAFAAATVITALGLGIWSIRSRPSDVPAVVADAGGTPAQTTPATVPPATPPASPLDNSPGPVTDFAASARPDTAEEPAADAAAEPAPPASTDPQTTIDAVAQPEATTVAAVDQPSPSNRKSRTVQFTAPRGTRIIWTLDPNFESPVTGREPGKEQEQ